MLQWKRPSRQSGCAAPAATLSSQPRSLPVTPLAPKRRPSWQGEGAGFQRAAAALAEPFAGGCSIPLHQTPALTSHAEAPAPPRHICCTALGRQRLHGAACGTAERTASRRRGTSARGRQGADTCMRRITPQLLPRADRLDAAAASMAQLIIMRYPALVATERWSHEGQATTDRLFCTLLWLLPAAGICS